MKNNITQLQQFNEFAEAAYLNKQHDPWVRRREPGKIYANVLIASCQHKDWWYRDFVGVECFVELRFFQWGQIREATAVRLTNTKVIHGRDIDVKDFIII